MKTSDFDYELPEELIAQTPVEPRDHSRQRCSGTGTSKISSALPSAANRRAISRAINRAWPVRRPYFSRSATVRATEP